MSALAETRMVLACAPTLNQMAPDEGLWMGTLGTNLHLANQSFAGTIPGPNFVAESYRRVYYLHSFVASIYDSCVTDLESLSLNIPLILTFPKFDLKSSSLWTRPFIAMTRSFESSM